MLYLVNVGGAGAGFIIQDHLEWVFARSCSPCCPSVRVFKLFEVWKGLQCVLFDLRAMCLWMEVAVLGTCG